MGWSLFLYWKKLNCSLLLFSVSFRIFIHFRYVLFGLSFSNVSSLHILSLILHGSLYLFLLPFFLKFCNSSASFVWERGWDRSLFLSCESIISIMLFSPSPSVTLFPFRQWKFVKQVSLEGCPKSSLISKTKPAKFASDSSPSALRTLFLQCITSCFWSINFIFHFITYSAWWKLWNSPVSFAFDCPNYFQNTSKLSPLTVLQLF